ncbi:ribonucleotide reductase class Ia beta subunit [Synechococcus phage Syn5]|uniref:ribonucleoside-diphosphate reductase n=1 Tax=Synechococcus phage Syn5 TaxID=2914003 RepID=A4ZRB5_9CAUD|nr:ribonucleotide reductase class Ia beta subunit [Synechococcus phage Syn5]ABP87941.1 gp34 [Synechococcus phage Syn5]
MSDYLKIMSRKRTWTPVAVDKGQVIDGAEDTLKRCLALRTLELPVKEMLQQGLERELPDDPGIIPALRSNQADEDKHDLALNYIVDAHGVDERAEAEAERIRKAWLSNPSHPILKTAILERSVFFVLLPFFRFNGDMGIRTVASDISRDEQTHTLIHAMVAHDLGEKTTPALDKLRKATVHWAMDQLGVSDNKYLNKDFWLRASDNLYHQGKATELVETQRARMPAFFEASNVNLPKYG